MHKISAWKTDEKKEEKEKRKKTKKNEKQDENRNVKRKNETKKQTKKRNKTKNEQNVKQIKTTLNGQIRWMRAPNLRSRKNPLRTSKKKKIPNSPANYASTRDEHLFFRSKSPSQHGFRSRAKTPKAAAVCCVQDAPGTATRFSL